MPFTLHRPAWLSTQHPIVWQELLHFDRARAPAWRLSPKDRWAYNLGSGLLVWVAMVSSFWLLISWLPAWALFAIGLVGAICGEVIVAMIVLPAGAQLITRERLCRTWNALRLTPLSDTALIGGKVYALLRFEGLAWAGLHLPRLLVGWGFSQLGQWPGQAGLALQENALILMGAWLLVLAWLVVHPVWGGVCQILAGMAVATLGRPQITNGLVALCNFGLFIFYASGHLLLPSLISALLAAVFSPGTYLAWQRQFPLLLWGQIAIVQVLLYTSVGAVSLWILAKRLPYLTE